MQRRIFEEAIEIKEDMMTNLPGNFYNFDYSHTNYSMGGNDEYLLHNDKKVVTYSDFISPDFYRQSIEFYLTNKRGTKYLYRITDLEYDILTTRERVDSKERDVKHISPETFLLNLKQLYEDLIQEGAWEDSNI